MAKHCMDDPASSTWPTTLLHHRGAVRPRPASGDNVLKGSLLDDDDDEADDTFGTPTKSSAVALDACRELQARWERRERRAHHQGHGAEDRAVCPILRVPRPTP